MYDISKICFTIIVVFSYLSISECVCCFGIRKVCESLADVSEQGNEEWKSLIITPGRCQTAENKTEYETITSNTLTKTPNLTNIYIVNTLVDIKEKSFEPVEKSLVYLSIIQNNITKITADVFQDLSRLKKLVLRDNGIKEIVKGAFKNLPKLEVLLLSGNEFTEVKADILNTVDFKSVDLSFNKITKIEMNAFPKSLILLNLKKNELSHIEDSTFSNLNSLEMLILSKNKLKKIRRGTFAGLNNLSKLDLSRNELTEIEQWTFSELHELMFLYLKHNYFQVLKADVFATKMINLTDLELENNNLTFLSKDVFKCLPKLEEISIGGNPWQCRCLEDMQKILNIREISVSDSDVYKPKCLKNDENKCDENV